MGQNTVSRVPKSRSLIQYANNRNLGGIMGRPQCKLQLVPTIRANQLRSPLNGQLFGDDDDIHGETDITAKELTG
jgi:hypothetical protein